MPLPLFPLALPATAPPRHSLADASPPPRLVSPEFGRAIGAGIENFVGARDDGGLSTKDVSVVMKVSSPSSGRIA